MAKSYGEVVCAVGGNPEAAVVTGPANISLPERSIVPGDNPSDCDSVTVVRKKRVTPSTCKHCCCYQYHRKPQDCHDWSEKLFFSLLCAEEGPQEVSVVSLFSPDVTASDVEKSLKDQLQLASIACTRLETEHNHTPRFMSLLQRMIYILSVILVVGQTAV
jgi:hypothetical protein